MKTSHLYTADFPEEHKVQCVDIITLYHEGRFEELDAVVICKDRDGNVTATFGQSNWDCLPFSRKKEEITSAYQCLTPHLNCNVNSRYSPWAGFLTPAQKEKSPEFFRCLFSTGKHKKNLLFLNGAEPNITGCAVLCAT